MAQIRRYNRQDEEIDTTEVDEIAQAAAEAVEKHAKGTAGYDYATGHAEQEEPVESPSKARRFLVVLAVVLASIIMVLSILLPSLSAVIEALMSGSSDTAAETTEAETTEAETTEAETEDATAGYIETIDERYGTTADALKAKVEADPTDKASIINLANTYYEWGTSLTAYNSDDSQTSHIEEVMQNGLTYYDQYLALEDSNAAHANRAVCQFYSGDYNGALEYLEDFCNRVTDYAPAWADLGMIYSAAGDTDRALEAYNKALEVDPDNTYGLQSSIESQISSLESE